MYPCYLYLSKMFFCHAVIFKFGEMDQIAIQKKVIPGAIRSTELNKHSKICSTTIYQMSNYVDFGWKSSPLYCMPSKRFVAVQFSKRYAFMLERIWQEINNSLLSFLSFVSWNDVIFSNQSFVVVCSFISYKDA